VQASEARGSALISCHGGNREREARRLSGRVFPYQGGDIKTWIETLKKRFEPDRILTHRSDDARRDHREISKLT
jgi:hypothetical protein